MKKVMVILVVLVVTTNADITIRISCSEIEKRLVKLGELKEINDEVVKLWDDVKPTATIVPNDIKCALRVASSDVTNCKNLYAVLEHATIAGEINTNTYNLNYKIARLTNLVKTSEYFNCECDPDSSNLGNADYMFKGTLSKIDTLITEKFGTAAIKTTMYDKIRGVNDDSLVAARANRYTHSAVNRIFNTWKTIGYYLTYMIDKVSLVDDVFDHYKGDAAIEKLKLGIPGFNADKISLPTCTEVTEVPNIATNNSRAAEHEDVADVPKIAVNDSTGAEHVDSHQYTATNFTITDIFSAIWERSIQWNSALMIGLATSLGTIIILIVTLTIICRHHKKGDVRHTRRTDEETCDLGQNLIKVNYVELKKSLEK